ncbi:MAG: nicotinate-nicotinamide nucleotide adenylyltransferase [Patescibacteria group bacterium]|nr:nicotinate-nicotinamide nucleotide adenylyltransferase [Patescibacteria group bacterium]
MKKVLLFPGAFNPPHYGHVEIIRLALQKKEFDELWIMPSGKRRDKIIDISYRHRVNLGKLFVSYLKTQIELPIILLDNELSDNKGRYTDEIMSEIKSKKDVSITQLIGSDGIMNLYNENPSILDKETFVVSQRVGNILPNDFPKKNVDIINGTSIKISSTKIRELIRKHDWQYNKYIPEDISKYINDHNLYGG